MTVLVVGADGLLGSNVLGVCHERGRDAVGTYHSLPPRSEGRKLDLRDHDRIETLLAAVDPDAVCNCAAMTDVDACESAPERARDVNATAPGAIAAACADRGIALTHVSTDYVFDGTASEPYDEDATPNPVQVYGETKLAGERAVRSRHPDPTIVRPSFLFGIHRATDEPVGFPAWVRSRLREGTDTPLFVDQYVTPTRARGAAETLLSLQERKHTGTYHVASRTCLTPHAFGQEIRARMDAPAGSLHADELADVDRPARRPRNTCLAVDAIEDALDRPQPSLEQALDRFFNDLDALR